MMKRWPLPVVTLLLGLLIGSYFLGTYSHGQNNPPPPIAAIPREVTSFRDLAKQVLPAVVSIEAKAKTVKTVIKNKPAPQLPDNIPEEFRRFFEENRQFPDAGAEPRLGFGSGFFIDPKGIVLTNFHVVDGAEQVMITLNDHRKFVSKEIKVDRRTDLAIVKLDLKGATVPYLELGDSEAMEIGDRVLAVGAPFGLTGSVTHGIISAKGRAGLQMNMYEDFLQTDAAINPGNSGGPLVNLQGQAVGINAAIKSRSGGFQGVGLAVASNLAKQVVKALQTDGVVHRGYLGVQIRELDPEVGERFGIPRDTGVVVAEVFDKTPAAKAGLQAGDIITGIGGKIVKDGRILQNIVASLPIGKASEFSIVRDGKSRKLSVTIEEQPTEFGTASVPAPRLPRSGQESVALDKIGVEIMDVNDELAENMGYRKGTLGVVITEIQPGSVSFEAGLRRGMLITKIDNQKVNNAQAARQALQTASLQRGILLQVQSPQGGTNFVLLRSDASSE
jgi:serine protease Do